MTHSSVRPTPERGVFKTVLRRSHLTLRRWGSMTFFSSWVILLPGSRTSQPLGSIRVVGVGSTVSPTSGLRSCGKED
nr:hypothetical protein [Saccharolobus solfataricus]